MAIRPSILAGPNEKDRAKVKTATDPEWGSSSWTGIHGKPALDPAYIEEQQKDIYRPNGLGNRGENGTKNETVTPQPVEGMSPPNFETDASGYEDMDEYYKDLASGKINAKGEVIDTSAGTTPSTSGEQSDGSYYFKDYDDIMNFISGLQGQAGDAHNIYKDQMSSASGYADDFGKWLQGIRDIIMNEAKANPLESDWGKEILDYYGVLGDNSANAVNAATAGENAGNIDSFAAANAERQRVSKLGQGIQSVMGMSTERFNNMIAGLNSIGVNTDLLFGAQRDLVDTSAGYAADLYKTDADSTNEYNKLLYSSSGNTTYDLSDNAVKAYLMDAYNSLNTVNGNSDEIDWSTTDKEIWDDVIAALQKDGIYGQLSVTYLNKLIAQIMQGAN